MKDGAEPDVDCPIPIEVLSELNGADPSDALAAVSLYSEQHRVRLALFCYNRSHLRKLALTIASSIDPARLAELAGTIGEVLAAQSQASGLSFGTEPITPPGKRRAEKPKPKISLGGRSY